MYHFYKSVSYIVKSNPPIEVDPQKPIFYTYICVMGIGRLPSETNNNRSILDLCSRSILDLCSWSIFGRKELMEGDTVFDTKNNTRYFIPSFGKCKTDYIHSCKMILTEKVNPIIHSPVLIRMVLGTPRLGAPKRFMWQTEKSNEVTHRDEWGRGTMDRCPR